MNKSRLDGDFQKPIWHNENVAMCVIVLMPKHLSFVRGRLEFVNILYHAFYSYSVQIHNDLTNIVSFATTPKGLFQDPLELGNMLARKPENVQSELLLCHIGALLPFI